MEPNACTAPVMVKAANSCTYLDANEPFFRPSPFRASHRLGAAHSLRHCWCQTDDHAWRTLQRSRRRPKPEGQSRGLARPEDTLMMAYRVCMISRLTKQMMICTHAYQKRMWNMAGSAGRSCTNFWPDFSRTSKVP